MSPIYVRFNDQPEQAKDTYLGDGLYAQQDQYGMIVLWAERDGIKHWVGLEPEVLKRFLNFVGEQ